MEVVNSQLNYHKDMRQVTITLRRKYVETIEHTIEVPDHIGNSEVDEWLASNPNLYDADMDDASKGVGTWDSDEWRYDVEEVVNLKKHLFGGSL
jgi:hypothetical protein